MSALRGSVRKVALDRELDQADEVVDVQLAHEAGTVGVHGLGADFQQVRDVLGAQPTHKVGKDLRLAGAEGGQRICHWGAWGPGKDAGAAQQRRDVDAAVAHEADGVQKVARGPVLQQVGIRAGPQGLHDGGLFPADGEDQ